jgi:hypothetical protein
MGLSCHRLYKPRLLVDGAVQGSSNRQSFSRKDGFMAGKPLNRLDLRRQREAAEPLDPMEDETNEVADEVEEDDVAERKPKKKAKAPAKPKAKAKSTRASKPTARMRIVWVVKNDAYKPVGTFEYSQKEAADARAAELTAKGKGTHFVQKEKEPMPEDAPGIGAAIPRTVAAPTKASRKQAQAAVVEEEETEEEEEEENEPEVEEDDDEE